MGLLIVLLGTLVIAMALIRVRARQPWSDPAPGAFSDRSLSTDVINMSRIRVAGLGGLGLVAMAVAAAFGIPRIGQSLAIGLVLGVGFAVALIVKRRRKGPMPSSGRRAGANTILAIDQPQADAATRTTGDPCQELQAAPHQV